eukprot:CAMPEP_0196793994 /NCGR_PEP_ID=MMETSP1104-20130614/33812_1 /TAXON_ID=33652 /ORGANISM="Cafeteria sp., Strain Caron Lab Isolate" /LENGTH=56 /DNA_ID=CAMNT_0042164369 /DNA_START=49 /DNA_END=215 /DNA_ORIENTATION=+
MATACSATSPSAYSTSPAGSHCTEPLVSMRCDSVSARGTARDGSGGGTPPLPLPLP